MAFTIEVQRKGRGYRTHGMTGSPTYASWESMIQRCTNPKASNYHLYGGSGIQVCARWLESFENFLADMGVRPEGKTLGRIRNSKNYYPLNCEWQTQAQQANNTRTNRYLFHDRQMKTVREWCRQLGLNEATIRSRVRGGWSSERIFSENKTSAKAGTTASGFPYVYPSGNGWVARFLIDGKMVYVGQADDPIDAYLLRVAFATEHNIPLPEGDRFLRSSSQKKMQNMSVRDISGLKKDGVA